jgi:roadblock/LC7 domain-containing protein
MNPNQKDWGHSRKMEARRQTIILPYQMNFSKALPLGKQYWSMCGQCTTKNCEFDQMVKEGFITPEQFRGVEINPAIHQLNVEKYPDLHWFNEDFYYAMANGNHKKSFNPGIVNIDTLLTPDGDLDYVGRILAMLTDLVDEVMCVANLIVKKQFYAKDGYYAYQKMVDTPLIKYTFEHGNWSIFHNAFYAYCGTGDRSRTTMSSFIFIKKDNR